MAPDRSDPQAPRELVALHCEATSFDPATAAPRVVAAIPLHGNRVLTSRALVVALGTGPAAAEGVEQLRALIGDRPLVGYFLDFSAGLVERLLGAPLPGERIEVSSLFYDRKSRTPSKRAIDLRLDRLIGDLDLPLRPRGDAYGTALVAALAYLRLTER
ncbi:DNA polymerase III [Azospirillum thermophilum]|uniref:DNA polymerase III n=1 Tax=Azospirillum thermophilum TaxID=2202148 RepID=A0A2S2CNZ8_9PROT|nr:DNA polymerase III [Azospirillum thermophilum]AWK86169.1 DNA polymerase III [Azospirillum thermophilum]